MTDEEVQRVLDSIDALGENGDAEGAEDRGRRLTELLDQWPDTHVKVRAMRQQAFQELKNGGMTLKEIGALYDLSFGRVRQILAGDSAGPAKRAKTQAKPESPSAE